MIQYAKNVFYYMIKIASLKSLRKGTGLEGVGAIVGMGHFCSRRRGSTLLETIARALPINSAANPLSDILMYRILLPIACTKIK